MSQNRLVFLPLGGSGEIGMNMNMYGYGEKGQEKWIMIDCGVTFGNSEAPGIDLVLPDPSYMLDKVQNLLGIVMTHAHEDHIGAIAYLWPYMQVPIYATPFTARMIRDKFADRGMNIGDALRVIQLKQSFPLGPFHFEYVTLTHSIPEPNALIVTTPVGKIFHTGDWKLDENPLIGEATDIPRLQKLGQEGVLAMVCDSTNALDEGWAGSEGSVLEPLTKLIHGSRGRVAITTFASNAARLKTVMQACKDAERGYVMCGRSIDKIFRIGKEMGYFTGLPEPISMQDAEKKQPNQVAYICTGSQGEKRSALWRIAAGQHADLKLSEGDTVIFSSKIIPGNEKGVFELLNMLAARSVQVITAKQANIHVSGHPYRDELRQMYDWIKPQMSIPVHGETIHMQEHARLALSCGVPMTFVPKNGDLIELYPQPLVLDQQVPAGRLYVDGNIIDDAEGGATSERIRLQSAGVIVLHFVLNAQGALITTPAVTLQGVPYLAEEKDQKNEDYIASLVAKYFMEIDERDRLRDDRVREHVRLSLRRTLQQVWGKKPLVEIGFSRIHSTKPDQRLQQKSTGIRKPPFYRTGGHNPRRDRDEDRNDRQGAGGNRPAGGRSFSGQPPRDGNNNRFERPDRDNTRPNDRPERRPFSENRPASDNREGHENRERRPSSYPPRRASSHNRYNNDGGSEQRRERSDNPRPSVSYGSVFQSNDGQHTPKGYRELNPTQAPVPSPNPQQQEGDKHRRRRGGNRGRGGPRRPESTGGESEA